MAATGITIENMLNPSNDGLPYGLFDPSTEGKLTWICNYGTDGDVISVFSMTGSGAERDVKILKDLTEARYVRDELYRHGWRILTPPKIEFTMTGEDGVQRPLNRKEKRFIDRELEKK